MNQKQYFWRAIGTDAGITVVVVTEAAFDRGKRAQQLVFRLSYDHHHEPLPHGATALHQQAIVTPDVIRVAIEVSQQLPCTFSGAHGLDDVHLVGEDLAQVQRHAHVQWPRDLAPQEDHQTNATRS